MVCVVYIRVALRQGHEGKRLSYKFLFKILAVNTGWDALVCVKLLKELNLIPDGNFDDWGICKVSSATILGVWTSKFLDQVDVEDRLPPMSPEWESWHFSFQFETITVLLTSSLWYPSLARLLCISKEAHIYVVQAVEQSGHQTDVMRFKFGNSIHLRCVK